MVKSAMQNIDEQIRKIEAKLEEYFESHPIMSLPYHVAVQYMLFQYEEFNHQPILMGKHIPGVNRHEDLARIQNNKDSLTCAINRVAILARSKSEKIVSKIEENHYIDSANFFIDALSDSASISAYTLWSRGIANAEIVNDTSVKFEFNKNEIRYDVLESKLNLAEVKNNIEDIPEDSMQPMLEAKDALFATVKQTGEDTIIYSTKNQSFDKIYPLISHLINGHTLPPQDWQFDGISVDQFKLFWFAVMSLCMLHRFALHYAATALGIKGGAIASSVITRAKTEWVRQISKIASLEKDVVSKILDLHIYNIKHSKPDIVLTPFIYVTEKHLALPPTLINTNNLGRNLLKHLSKNYKAEFDNISNTFSESLVKYFNDSMNGRFFSIISNKRIPGKDTLPDVDLCLIDKTKKQVMICELKWTIPPAEPSEILAKIETEEKAIDQLSKLRDYFIHNPHKVREIFEIDFDVSIEDVFYIGVFKNHVGRDSSFNRELPIVEYSILCNLLDEKESLSEAYKEIQNRTYLPTEGKDFDVVAETYPIGDYEIIWSGYTAK